MNKAYEDLLTDVLTTGTYKSDRTGTGTISKFGVQMRFDLSEGFPLITTKKVHMKSIVHELIWFLSGDTNTKYLTDNGVTIWNEWSSDEGNLGPVYGKQFRHVSSYLTVEPKIFEKSSIDAELPVLMSKTHNEKDGVKNSNERTVFGVGYYGSYNKTDPYYEILVSTWREMIRRCYDKTSKPYSNGYGASGVHVSERWQCFANFQADARLIPDWELKFEYPEEYSLDKDTRFASNRYDVSTCMWASENVQNANRSNSKYFTAIDPEGNKQVITSIGRLKRDFGLNVSAVHRCLNGLLKTHHGWSEFQYILAPEGLVTRYCEVDQLKAVVARLKHNPDSRRHIISLWNPSEIHAMALPPCHGNIIQFYISDDKLSCQMYQRSADLFLGEPFNIASYALLTHMIAQQTGLEVGDFVHTIGDAHIYLNHVDQVKLQLERDPRSFPQLKLNKAASIDDYKYEDVEIIGYDPHPAIKGEVAI